MKATGIIRRIDDLGRVVIPKEIRRTLRLREGDPMEIYTSDEGVTFKKYDYTQNVSSAISDLEFAVCQEDDIQNKNPILLKIKELREMLSIEKDNI